MIVRTDNFEFKRILELLEQEGFIINCVKQINGIGHPTGDKEVVLQKDNIQIKINDLRY